MKRPTITIDIDRLVLADLDLTPDRAEQLRVQVTGQVQRLLESGEGLEALAGAEVRQVNAPIVHLAELHGEGHLASSLARSIVQAVRGAGQAKGEGKYVRI